MQNTGERKIRQISRVLARPSNTLRHPPTPTARGQGRSPCFDRSFASGVGPVEAPPPKRKDPQTRESSENEPELNVVTVITMAHPGPQRALADHHAVHRVDAQQEGEEQQQRDEQPVSEAVALLHVGVGLVVVGVHVDRQEHDEDQDGVADQGHDGGRRDADALHGGPRRGRGRGLCDSLCHSRRIIRLMRARVLTGPQVFFQTLCCCCCCPAACLCASICMFSRLDRYTTSPR